jgi:hypothetical protein
MKKYLESTRSSPYSFMGSHINQSMNPQMNIPMSMHNPYMYYPGSLPYNQMRSMPKTISNTMPYSQFSSSNNYSTISPNMYIPSQFMGNYPPNMMSGGYGQTPPSYASQYLPYEKP